MNSWTLFFTLFSGLVTAGSVVGLSYAVLRIRRRARRPEKTREFALERYRPMGQLLAAADWDFLRKSPGFTPQLGARWKRQQLGLMQMYLDDLRGDFRTLHREARALAAARNLDNPEIVQTLVRQRVRFEIACGSLQLQILAARAGWGWADATPILEAAEAMRVELQRLVPRPAPTLVV